MGELRRSKTYYINEWDTWKELCQENGIDPYEESDFSQGVGGGDSIDFEFVGDYPEKEE